jgi:hypothetical protein
MSFVRWLILIHVVHFIATVSANAAVVGWMLNVVVLK